MADIARVVSISLGPSSRDKTVECDLLGKRLLIERLGTDGHIGRFARFLRQYDGVADVLCLGGINRAIQWRDRHYPFTQVRNILREVKKTPVVDGGGLKATLEPRTLQALRERGIVDLQQSRVLVMSAFDRYPLEEAICGCCHDVIYGDLMFSLGIPLAVRSLDAMNSWARLLLPVVTRLPHNWAFATGMHSDRIVSGFEHYYEWADLIAGDFSLIRHYMPDQLAGKTILTNSITPDDIMLLKARGLKYLVTTSPEIEGRTFATNVMEGVFVSLLGRPPEQLTAEDYFGLAEEIRWEPVIRDIAAA